MGLAKRYTFNNRIIKRGEEHYISIDRYNLARRIDEALQPEDLAEVKRRLKLLLADLEEKSAELLSPNGEGVLVKPEALHDELEQMIAARTRERLNYYAGRLKRSLFEVITNGTNDINLRRWKDYDEIVTDSLWVIDRRDGSGAHLAWYWGNFIPQIPHQLLLRYTRRGDLVVDPFVGSGTTLIECRRLGRHGIGIEIGAGVCARARERVEAEPNPYGVRTEIVTGDARLFDLSALVEDFGFSGVDFYLMHPPYHDIITFTSVDGDLSNAPTTEDFLRMFGEVLDNTLPLLKRERYAAVVIGDKYEKGEWVPLGFYCMEEAMRRGLVLKSIVVKNFEETKGKRFQKELWRYRALLGGFYVFKHEYILILKKP